MSFMPKTLALAAALTVGSVSAAPIVLTFEGIGNLNPVANFYNGGGGTNYGVSFSQATLAIIDADAGGSGNIANEPSPSTVMFFLDANNAVLNFAAGFDTGFAFLYSSSTAASVRVYDGLNATGNLLGTLSLTAQYNSNCQGDPSGQFCNWTDVGVAFSGIAKSIDFGGTANQTAFDNITFGASTAVNPIPEPSTYALMAMGLAAVGWTARRRKARAA